MLVVESSFPHCTPFSASFPLYTQLKKPSSHLCDRAVHFHVMSLQDCFLVWVGFSPSLRNLAMAMCSRYDTVPLSTLILGDKSDPTSSSFAQRLAMKTKKQVFVSISIPTTDSQLLLLIEKRIKQEMETFPEKF
ncbi:proteasome assembly chaperone 4-like [Rana temporaria]|uniref:proteasome assembly chaperone 4-like n=1 Tax=Rana temporaria TaxID=8407 RepID=UPI001AACB29E|nr:proteasome assembly chaperone 4-like [Rana temporaria]